VLQHPSLLDQTPVSSERKGPSTARGTTLPSAAARAAASTPGAKKQTQGAGAANTAAGSAEAETGSASANANAMRKDSCWSLWLVELVDPSEMDAVMRQSSRSRDVADSVSDGSNGSGDEDTGRQSWDGQSAFSSRTRKSSRSAAAQDATPAQSRMSSSLGFPGVYVVGAVIQVVTPAGAASIELSQH